MLIYVRYELADSELLIRSFDMASQLDKPSQWTTSNDAPTEKQKSFISTLAAEKGAQNINPNEMSKSEASQKIGELKNQDTQNSGASAGEPIQNPDTWTTGEDQATGKQTGVTLHISQYKRCR